MDAAAEHLAERLDDDAGQLGLHYVPTRARLERALGVEGLVVHREHKDGQLGVACLDVPDKMHAGLAVESEIDDHGVRLPVSDMLESLSSAVGAAADLEVVRHRERLSKTLPENRVAVYDEDPGARGTRIRQITVAHRTLLATQRPSQVVSLPEGPSAPDAACGRAGALREAGHRAREAEGRTPPRWVQACEAPPAE